MSIFKNKLYVLKYLYKNIVIISVYNMNFSQDHEKYLKIWLNFNCVQDNNWIVIYKFDEIVNSPESKCYMIENGIIKQTTHISLNRCDLSHIYFTYMTESILVSLIELYDGRLLLINNTLELCSDETSENGVVSLPKVKNISSNVYVLNIVYDLKLCVSKKLRKLIGIYDKNWLYDNFKESQKKEFLSKINFYDFIHIRDQHEYMRKFRQYIEQSNDRLSLINNYSIQTELLNQLSDYPQVHELVIYQNFQINDFKWLNHFPNLKLINIFNSQQLEQKHFEQIRLYASHLEVVNIHYCTRINLRILIPLFKLDRLAKLAIEDANFWCQLDAYREFISNDEWKLIYCPSLEQLAINSDNLTIDIVDYILCSCPNLKHVIVDSNLMKNISNRAKDGYKEDTIIFCEWGNTNKGIIYHKDIKFTNLRKDMSEPFSESMLQKINKIKTERGEKEQTPL